MGDTSYSQNLSAQQMETPVSSCIAGCMKSDLAYAGDNRGRLSFLPNKLVARILMTATVPC